MMKVNPVRIGLAPRKQFRRRGRHLLHLGRVVLEQRSGRHERHDQRVVLRKVVHLARGGKVVVEYSGKLRGVVRQDLDPEALVDARGQRAHAGQYQINVGAACRLHRLQFCREFRRRSLAEGDLGDEIRILGGIGFDGALRKRQVAGNVDDVDRDGALGQRGNLRAGRRGS